MSTNSASHDFRHTIINFDIVDRLTDRKLGTFNTTCPLCSHFRKPQNQKLKIFKIWRPNERFASYNCAHCDAKGYSLNRNASPLNAPDLQRLRIEAEAQPRTEAIERQSKARWLWGRAISIAGSIAETYLREIRHYKGPLPATLRFLPALADYPPALIAAFGLADEPEPGVLAIDLDKVAGVQLTRLAPDGSGKAGTDSDKITIGRCLGTPIVLAPPNDLLGLGIAEGIEDALSLHQSSGLGSWASGGAGRLPALAAAIPDYIESVTVLVDNDTDGERNAGELVRRLALRGIEVNSIRLVGQQK